MTFAFINCNIFRPCERNFSRYSVSKLLDLLDEKYDICRARAVSHLRYVKLEDKKMKVFFALIKMVRTEPNYGVRNSAVSVLIARFKKECINYAYIFLNLLFHKNKNISMISAWLLYRISYSDPKYLKLCIKALKVNKSSSTQGYIQDIIKRMESRIKLTPLILKKHLK